MNLAPGMVRTGLSLESVQDAPNTHKPLAGSVGSEAASDPSAPR
ncbi:uncharacterized protein CMC5_047400 [Chondromyces crocatus]|uniref:Uncharacterized protein n=1 Tax=Chondromyces crocatus TaxID=52 RepID=A0A0K1EIB0_CHOCO|nr:uncharacterized protein CMC5_047400 [Chondromyces crocatus]